MENGNGSAVVVARDVTRRYGEGETVVEALRGVTVEIAPGKSTAVMGPSGSGKSTLMHILAGLDKPTSGSVDIAGTEITTLGDNALTMLRREHIGFVFQFFNLLPMLDAKENILLPLTIAGTKPDDGWFEQVVADVGLQDRLSHRPAELSGGQQQRVAIARALISRPTVLFADEPTGNLDSSTSAEILELLRRSVDEYGQTIVMVTHDARAAAVAHRVLFLADGEIVRELGQSQPARDPHGHGRSRGSVIKVALRGLAGRKLRAVLTAIAIVLGVAMISGTYILTDTINRAFTTLFTESYAGTDAVVTGKGLDISIDGETPPKPPVDASLLETVRGVEGVALATGTVLDERYTKILNSDGEAVSSEGAPTFGFGIDTDPALAQFNPLSILEGRWPASADEVVIDAGTADDRGYDSGIPSRSRRSSRSVRSSSSASRATAASTASGMQASRCSRFRPRRSCWSGKGSTTRSPSPPTEGVTEDELVAAIAPVLPASATVVSATAEAAEAVDEVNEFTAIFRYFLLVFAGIALFVGAFVIFNTFSITVAQRTREFATLRTIGASRRQILGSVILESLVIGLLASLVGLGLGVLLAEGIEGLFRALGVELPTADRVFAVRTVIVALAVGVGITLLAGLFPAIKATRVPPIAAVREGATLPKSRFAPFVPWIGGLVIVVALAVLARAMFTDELGTSDRLLSIAAGVVLLFLGVASLASHIVRPLAVVSSPIGRWAAFVFTVLFWPFWLLPYWLLRYGAWGPGAAVRRVVAFVGGALLNPLLLPIVLVMWLRRACDVLGAGVAVGVPWRRPGSRGRSHRRRERPQEPEPDGGDCSGADDRDRTRRVHRDPDERDEGVEPRSDRGADRGRLCRDLSRRVHAVRRGCG